MIDTDFKPFLVCYVWKIIKGCWKALWDTTRYEFVYSASDFWMDALPAFILKLKGIPWVAGFYMFAPKGRRLYEFSQKVVIPLIERFADVVCVTNESLFKFNKPCVAVHGGVNLELVCGSNEEKLYDAVFVGRLHYTKGIKDLMDIWDRVIKKIPSAKLAIIGDGDGEAVTLKAWALSRTKNVKFLGFMGDERFNIYRKSKVVLYPTPHQYSHFSMAPIEAMACGCPMVAYDIPEMSSLDTRQGVYLASDIDDFTYYINQLIVKWDSILEVKVNAMNYGRTWDWSLRSKEIIRQIRSHL